MPRISELPSGVPVSTGDTVPLVQSGTTKKATFNDLPISSATQTALNAKADANNSNLTGTTTAATVNATNVSVSGTLSGAGVTKAAVGLGNVDNTSDVNKPVSTAQATAIAAVTGFKNRVRNGRMEIPQRGTSFPALAAGSYCLDGWKWFQSGAHVITASQQSNSNSASDFQSVLRVTVTTANATPGAGDYALMTQPIEGFMVRDLVGNPIAIRFEVKSPKTGTHCVVLRNSGSDRSYILTYTVNSANTPETKTLSLPTGLITAGTWNFNTGLGLSLGFCMMAGTSFQTTSGSWQTGNFLGTSAQVNCMDTIGNVFEITGVQLERASSSTAYEHRDMASETVLNQRYFEILEVVHATTPSSTQNMTSYWHVEKRATPTLSATQVSGSGMPTFTVTGNGRALFQTTAPGGLGTAQITISAEL